MIASAHAVKTAADLRSVIREEYLEMPGLILTLPQAIRLWNAEPGDCAAALNAVVESGFLHRAGKTYMRADCRRRCA
jgi:hypothetical protein